MLRIASSACSRCAPRDGTPLRIAANFALVRAARIRLIVASMVSVSLMVGLHGINIRSAASAAAMADLFQTAGRVDQHEIGAVLASGGQDGMQASGLNRDDHRVRVAPVAPFAGAGLRVEINDRNGLVCLVGGYGERKGERGLAASPLLPKNGYHLHECTFEAVNWFACLHRNWDDMFTSCLCCRVDQIAGCQVCFGTGLRVCAVNTFT